MRQSLLRSARALLAAIVVAGPSGCVKDTATSAPAERTDIAVWDFPPELGASVPLWPAGPRTPARSKHHVKTRDDPARLVGVVDGVDPYYVWAFELPVPAFAVHLELDALEEGEVQVFWSTPRCPVFAESCSAVAAIGRGRQTVEVLLDPRDPLRQLRVDLPDHPGATVVFDGIRVLLSAGLSGRFVPSPSVTETTVTPTGLVVTASAADPWLVVNTPGLVAERVTAVELVLRGAGAAPHLYWSTNTGAFAETASATLAAVDSGALTHRAKLRGRPEWTSTVRALRLDPGPGAGEYVVERLALVYDPAD